ncbi:MAG: pirin family protein [Alphaproteobacteria bacterium]|nr:pirin family protein [Alphaproteobacteria bacterium]
MASTTATPSKPNSPPRAIAHRTPGRRDGPITRLMSPGDLGEMVKPFIFLDLFEVDRFHGQGFPPHPHSGIATLTTFLEGSMRYADSTGKTGSLSAGSVEWLRAGAGVWHAGRPIEGKPMRGYQLWLALPPELELAPAESRYYEESQIGGGAPARVLLGDYAGLSSPIPFPMPLTYLYVRLRDGQRWTYQPGADHDVAWLALNSGSIEVSGAVLERELAIFTDGNGPIDMVAQGAVELVIGSAAKHRHPLFNGHYSVHTTRAALLEGERGIAELEHGAAVGVLRGAMPPQTIPLGER